MKLELKHLVYQNHKPLKVVFSDTNEVDIITQIDFENGIVSFLNRKENYLLSSGIFKLVLIPLSDLTKEIKKNNDIINFQKHFNQYDFEWLITSNNKMKLINSLDYFLVSKLFEWHFDVFGLIEKGLAIDINTL